MRERVLGYSVSAALLLLVLQPLRFPQGRDGFPLSSYPMFARDKSSPTLRLRYFVALTASGERRYVPPRLVANEEVLQARAVISRAVSRGKAEATRLCHDVARRVADDDDFDDVTVLRVVEGTHDAIAFLVDDEIGRERVVAHCEPPR